MEQFDAAIIGFGTAGLALGGALADDGQNIVVVEQSDTMYGGACVNNACIPTKALVESARLTAAVGGSIVEREERYTAAVDDMKELRSASRERNYRLKNLDAILLEANHDIHMLEVGGYPYYLKQRILGDRGHLSNELSGQLLCDILHDNLKHIMLGHLSKENNYARLAYETVKLEVTLADNEYKGEDLNMFVASRESVSDIINV